MVAVILLAQAVQECFWIVILVLGGTSGVNTCHYVDGTKFSYLTLVKTLQTGFGLFIVKNLVRGKLDNLI